MSNLVIPDDGTIGSASDTDAIAISSGGNVTLSQTLDGGAIGSAVTMSANQACVKTALNASGNPGIYACRAWINFDGGSGSIGTGRASANISSITDNGIGDYTVNFSTAMPDANYSPVVMTADLNYGSVAYISGSLSAGSFRINVRHNSGSAPGLGDPAIVGLAIFR
jgi:hypothetical protein